MLCSEVPVTTVVVSPQLSSYSGWGHSNRGVDRRKDEERKMEREAWERRRKKRG